MPIQPMIAAKPTPMMPTRSGRCEHAKPMTITPSIEIRNGENARSMTPPAAIGYMPT